MKNLIIRILLVTAFCVAASLTAVAQRAELPLTNASVVKLVRAGFREKTIIAIINNRPNTFNLEPDRLIELKKSGVSENIILAMLSQEGTFTLGDDDWTLGSTLGRDKRNGAGDEATDVFGSNSGSKGQSNGRGMSGANENDVTTTGSATVRILRPPTEAGGSSLKLEKTPTLTNDSVVKLVEAGFSEGTIIKRIEESPADFDLSSAKLAELRRKRVTEPIIAAMSAAMSEDPSDPKRPTRTKGN